MKQVISEDVITLVELEVKEILNEMNYYFLWLCLLLVSCTESRLKERSPILFKDGSFIFINLSVKVMSLDEINAEISFTNKSKSSVLFYEILLPLNDELKTNIFAVFNNTQFEEIPYTGKRYGEYMKEAPDDDDGVIIPDSSSENFLLLEPMKTFRYTVNLSKYFDFSSAKKGDSFYAVYSTALPAVTADYEQVFEKDSLDGKMKPVYYLLGLPKHENVDSMRVHFSIPD